MIPDNSKFFECVGNTELLRISFTLKRNGDSLFVRGPEKHWWLTGFKWGILSKPEELIMEACIDIPSQAMRQVFVDAVKGSGYQDVLIDGASVKFTFDKPKTHQPRNDINMKKFVDLAEANNRNIVTKYQELDLANNDPNELHDDVADEIISYFNVYKPEHLKKYVSKALEARGYQSKDLATSLKQVFSKSFFQQCKSALSRIFKRS
ncbi:MAG: DUF4474 domain-containing protein [Deltaproteobacteria bacterium]|nr:DUF4474 domain-containing protein [Deltaproteobacteria bacterium]